MSFYVIMTLSFMKEEINKNKDLIAALEKQQKEGDRLLGLLIQESGLTDVDLPSFLKEQDCLSKSEIAEFKKLKLKIEKILATPINQNPDPELLTKSYSDLNLPPHALFCR